MDPPDVESVAISQETAKKPEAHIQPEPHEVPKPASQATNALWDDSDPIVPWKASPIDHGELENDISNATKAPSASHATYSDVVNDFGDGRQLTESHARPDSVVQSHGESKPMFHGDFQEPSQWRPTSDGQLLTAELFAGLGAVFPTATNSLTPGEADILNQGETSGLADPAGDKLEDLKELEESIRAAFQRCAGPKGEQFLPLDALDRIVTRERVRLELAKPEHGVSLEKLDSFTDEIWAVTTTSSSNKTTRRRIFAILVLIQKVGTIVEFIQHGLYDIDLPFTLMDGPRPGSLQLGRIGQSGDRCPIAFLDKWKTYERESFDRYQWQLLSPYFSLYTKKDRKILHYGLPKDVILPFIEEDQITRGGFSDVWRVKIHLAHHNCSENSASPSDNPSWAVKKLHHSDPDVFNTEVSNLKRYISKDHLHLIKLLLTFSWRDHFYLLFPWADGNLLDFWKKHPSPSAPARDEHLARWFSKQCLGMVRGLKMIHTADKPKTADISHASAMRTHGLHGDLKPENILWFKERHNLAHECFMGVLKISDFGLMRFHGTYAKDNFKSVAVSPTYRAPEWDVADRTVAQSYDIWALGCVLLEFCAWYLLGWEEVDDFSKRRAGDDNSEIREDVFFDFVDIPMPDGQKQTGARAKRSVYDASSPMGHIYIEVPKLICLTTQEFKRLSELTNCCDFMIDLIDFIEMSLMRMNPNKRAECDEIVRTFEKIHLDCAKDKDYCTGRVKAPPERKRTNLSEITAAAIHLSPVMDKRIHRNPIPTHTGPVDADSQLPDQDLLDSPLETVRSRDSVFYTTPQEMWKDQAIEPPTQLQHNTLPSSAMKKPPDTRASGSRDNEGHPLKPQLLAKTVHYAEPSEASEHPGQVDLEENDMIPAHERFTTTDLGANRENNQGSSSRSTEAHASIAFPTVISSARPPGLSTVNEPSEERPEHKSSTPPLPSGIPIGVHNKTPGRSTPGNTPTYEAPTEDPPVVKWEAAAYLSVEKQGGGNDGDSSRANTSLTTAKEAGEGATGPSIEDGGREIHNTPKGHLTSLKRLLRKVLCLTGSDR